MAVGQCGRDVHRHAEAHRDVVRRAAERRAGLPAHRVLPLREGHAAQGRPARLQHPDGPHRAVEQLLQPGRPRPAAVLRGARARPRFHARAHGRVSAGHDERCPHLEHVPFRASPDRAHAPLPSLADDGDPSRDGREVRHQGRRLGVDGRPHGPRQAQGEAHAHHGPPHRLVRPRLVVARGRPARSSTTCSTSTSTTPSRGSRARAASESNYKSLICKVYKVEEGE